MPTCEALKRDLDGTREHAQQDTRENEQAACDVASGVIKRWAEGWNMLSA